MGIKNFSKAFKHTRIVKYKDLKGQIIAIDAMTELYRAALGAKTLSTLTDASGNPTLHISVILSIVIDLQYNGVTQIWVFDYEQDPNTDFHNPMKLEELAKRKKRKEIAIEQIKSLADVKDNDPLFSDDEDEPTTDSKLDSCLKAYEEAVGIPDAIPELKPVVLTKEEEAHVATLTYRQKAQFMLKKNTEAKHTYEQQLADYEFKKNKNNRLSSLEKQTFSVSKEMLNDVKLILTLLNIKYVEAPRGFEGEALASYLTQIGQADAVFSGDTDPIAYGAKVLLRRNPKDKLIYEYTQESILTQISAANKEYPEPTLVDFHKVAMILGTDACEKTPGIGPATVLKKLHDITLTAKQKAAMNEFTKIPDMDSVTIYNSDKEAFVDCKSETLIDWLVDEKSFTRSRIQKQLDKAFSENTPAKVIKLPKPTVRKIPKSPKSPAKKGKVILRKPRE